jgi:hypothetical protein
MPPHADFTLAPIIGPLHDHPVDRYGIPYLCTHGSCHAIGGGFGSRWLDQWYGKRARRIDVRRRFGRSR